MSNVSFRVDLGDKVGLVGRNGAGKTTLTKVLSGELPATAGQVQRSGEIGYLPQDPRSGDPEELARDRILNARGLGDLRGALNKYAEQMSSVDESIYEAALKKYSAAEARFEAA